jgi:hypothetical protein
MGRSSCARRRQAASMSLSKGKKAKNFSIILMSSKDKDKKWLSEEIADSKPLSSSILLPKLGKWHYIQTDACPGLIAIEAIE